MTTSLLRNSQEEFIHKNIHQILVGEAYEQNEANRACNFAIETYRTTASFGARSGKYFDFCLAKARQLLAPMKKTAVSRKRKASK